MVDRIEAAELIVILDCCKAGGTVTHSLMTAATPVDQ